MSWTEILKAAGNGSGAAVFRAFMLVCLLAIGGVLWDVRDTVMDIRAEVRMHEHRIETLERRVGGIESRERAGPDYRGPE